MAMLSVPDPYVFGPPGSGSRPPVTSKKIKKNLGFNCLVTSLWRVVFVMYGNNKKKTEKK
jgi:hypothetical protein